jgi:hypothetical protein
VEQEQILFLYNQGLVRQHKATEQVEVEQQISLFPVELVS